jgi:hypothetical protein
MTFDYRKYLTAKTALRCLAVVAAFLLLPFPLVLGCLADTAKKAALLSMAALALVLHDTLLPTHDLWLFARDVWIAALMLSGGAALAFALRLAEGEQTDFPRTAVRLAAGFALVLCFHADTLESRGNLENTRTLARAEGQWSVIGRMMTTVEKVRAEFGHDDDRALGIMFAYTQETRQMFVDSPEYESVRPFASYADFKADLDAKRAYVKAAVAAGKAKKEADEAEARMRGITDTPAQ